MAQLWKLASIQLLQTESTLSSHNQEYDNSWVHKLICPLYLYSSVKLLLLKILNIHFYKVVPWPNKKFITFLQILSNLTICLRVTENIMYIFLSLTDKIEMKVSEQVKLVCKTAAMSQKCRRLWMGNCSNSNWCSFEQLFPDVVIRLLLLWLWSDLILTALSPPSENIQG